MTSVRGLMLTTRQAADQLGLDPSQLHRWRRRGTGPQYVRLGRTVRYHPDALTAWVDSRSSRGATPCR